MKGLVFTYLLTYGGSAVSLFNPFIGLLIYVCFAIIKPDYLWAWSVPHGNYSRIVAVALLAGWGLNGFGCWQHFGRARIIVAALIGFWLWTVARATFADNQEVAWNYVEGLTKIVLPFLVGITLITSVTQLKQLAWVIVLSHGFLALEFNLSYFSGANTLRHNGFGGLDNNATAITLVTCVGLAFMLSLQTPNPLLKLLGFGATLLMLHAVFFSFSRGGMLALILTGIVTFLILPKRPFHYVVFAAMVFLSFRLAGPEVVERLGTAFADSRDRDVSASSRIELWSACFDRMITEPYGAGPGHWRLIAHEYGFSYGKSAHTLWLQFGAELGVPGFTLILLFYLLCLWYSWMLINQKAGPEDPWLLNSARMVIASLTGFIVSAQFVTVTMVEIPYYVVLIGAGTLKVVQTATEETNHVTTDKKRVTQPKPHRLFNTAQELQRMTS